MAYCIQKENCLTSENDDYWRSCVPVIRVTWLRLKYLVKGSTTEETTGKKERKEWLIWSVYQLYGNPVILERIQVERLIPEEIKKKKGYSFRRIAFFPFWSKRPKCSVLFALITNSRPLLETESEKFTVVLQIGLESISFPFLIRKQLSVPFVGKHRNFPTNVKRSWYFILEREKEREIENVAALRQIRGAISPKQTNKSKKARGYGSKADAFPFFAYSAKPLRKGTSSAA